MNLNLKALIGNIILFILEVIGLIICITLTKGLDLKYYTNWSNILGLLSSLFFIINYFIKERNNIFNLVVKYLRLTSTICLTVTLCVVLFIFVPFDHFNFYRWAIEGKFFSFHFFSPIVSIISFVFFERYDFKYIKDTSIGMIFTIIYSIVISILILTKSIPAPYPFLEYYNHSVIINILTVLVMLLIILGWTILYIFIKKKMFKNIKDS